MTRATCTCSWQVTLGTHTSTHPPHTHTHTYLNLFPSSECLEYRYAGVDLESVMTLLSMRLSRGYREWLTDTLMSRDLCVCTSVCVCVSVWGFVCVCVCVSVCVCVWGMCGCVCVGCVCVCVWGEVCVGGWREVGVCVWGVCVPKVTCQTSYSCSVYIMAPLYTLPPTHSGSRVKVHVSSTSESPSLVSMMISRHTGQSCSGSRPSKERFNSALTCLSSGRDKLNCVCEVCVGVCVCMWGVCMYVGCVWGVRCVCVRCVGCVCVCVDSPSHYQWVPSVFVSYLLFETGPPFAPPAHISHTHHTYTPHTHTTHTHITPSHRHTPRRPSLTLAVRNFRNLSNSLLSWKLIVDSEGSKVNYKSSEPAPPTFA